jgi:C1A family cysteine protease
MQIKFGVLLLLFSAIQCHLWINNKKFAAKDIETNQEKLCDAFESFLKAFNKSYPQSSEIEKRKKIFQENIKQMSKEMKKERNYEVNVNKFTDMSWEEFQDGFLMKEDIRKQFKDFKAQNAGKLISFQSLKNGDYFKFPKFEIDFNREKKITLSEDIKKVKEHLKSKQKQEICEESARLLQTSSQIQTTEEKQRTSALKRKVDWKPYTSKVQDSMRCAACYAFAAIGAYEALSNLASKMLDNLSEQEIVDCSRENAGCNGGNPFLVFDYINDRGIAFESRYPYTGQLGECKRISKSRKITKKVDYVFCDENIFDLLEAISVSPVAAVLYVNQNFKDYVSGVFDDPTCVGQLNHAMLAVGYDLDAPVPFINFKNAWADDWGEGGYIRMAIGPLTYANKGTCQLVNHDLNVIPSFK